MCRTSSRCFHHSRTLTSIRVLLLVSLLACLHPATGSDSCPAVCNCKWKSGKKSVECSDKGIITIPEGIDPETQLLDMSGNNLQTLPKETFVRAALLDLQKVYLRDCQIGQIDDRALQGLSNVVDLDLSRNLLTSIPSSILEDVPNLRNLSLAHNPIKKIDAYAFRYVSALTKLDLSYCSIAIIATHAFDGLEYLELLRLNGNQLTELRLDTVDTLNGLHGIELHDNPWHCDCGLRALKLWLIHKNVPYTIEPLCSSGPARIANRPFNQLQADDFACKPEMKIKPDHRYVDSVVGDNATVMCRVEAIPRANISWYWNGRLLLNNTAFSQHQRIHIAESGEEGECRSLLTLTNTQESDSSQQFYCVAENKAGVAEANFTLRIVHRLAGFPFLGNTQMTMLSAVLIVVIFLILVSIAYLLFCIRKMPPSARDLKHHAGDDRLANGVAIHGHHADDKSITVEPTLDIRAKMTPPYSSNTHMYSAAPQTLPRLNDMSYTTVFEDQLLDDARRASYHRNETSNPDLIADASQKAGEYTRATNHHDLFYPPSSLWNQNELPSYRSSGSNGTISNGGGSASAVVGSDYRDTNDKTPIIEEVAFYESQQQPLPPPRQPARRPKDCEFGTTASSSPLEPSPSSTTPTSAFGQPSAKTMRIWQKGVQVLPPVTALKRVLNRNSPDEGYQEGCGTDV